MILMFYMAIVSRMAGGGLGAHLLNERGAVGDDGRDLGGIMPWNLTWVPEVLFSIPLGVPCALITYWLTTNPLLALLSLILAAGWSYGWMQSAPGPALQWGDDPEDGMGRPRTLSPVVNWISDSLGFERGDINYCRTWMAVKGFLIGLPVGGVVLAVLWPLAYEGGYRLRGKVSFDPHAFTELAAGTGAALSILIFNAIIQ